MANSEHLAKLKEGVEAWNEWRRENPEIKPDLIEAPLRGFKAFNYNLSRVDFSGADLSHIRMSGVDMTGANLSNANLSKATIWESNLISANFHEADLFRAIITDSMLDHAKFTGGINMNFANISGSSLVCANMSEADLSYANLKNVILAHGNLFGARLRETTLMNACLRGASLEAASLIKTTLSGACLDYCSVYGISVWDIIDDNVSQQNLKIFNPHGGNAITVDDIQLAHFVYQLLDNSKLRRYIEITTSKAVLILGRFTDERKKVLDAIRDELRKRNFLPILFDFDKPATRDLTETISILAKLSRFVIVDLSDPRCVPHELGSIIPQTRTLPYTSIILRGQEPYSMFEDFSNAYHWVLKPFEYDNEAHLIENLSSRVIEPAERKVQEIRNK